MASTVSQEISGSESPTQGNLAPVCLGVVVFLVLLLQAVFHLVPRAWEKIPGMGAGVVSYFGLALVSIAVFAGGLVLASRFLRGWNQPGLKGGVFLGFVLALFDLYLASWWGKVAESWAIDRRIFSESVGAGLAAAGSALIVIATIIFFLKPSAIRLFRKLENQGWFSFSPFKPGQGQRVRRGTIVGLLVLLGSGVYAMVQGSSSGQAADWQIDVPFTGKVEVPANKAGDALGLLEKAGYSEQKPWVTREQFRLANQGVDPETHVKISTLTGDSKFTTGQVVSKEDYLQESRELAKIDRRPADVVSPKIAEGSVKYQAVVLLPGLQYSVPLLMLGFSFWLPWRVVNLPVFADFLIATEGELNKVSWTTRKRLVQDTLVVLSTLLLMAIFLFAMDLFWREVFTRTGVLKINRDTAQKNTNVDLKKW